MSARLHRVVTLAVTLALTVAVSLGAGCRRSRGASVKIAAASDLARAFEEVGREFRAQTGIEPRFTFGSSGLLAKQVGEGAPFAVFASANVNYVDEVVGKGMCDGASKRPYARGRIVAWTREAELKALTDLVDPRWKKIAIAHPDHAPYGKAAKQALETLGIWAQLEREHRLVFAENVRQTLQWAQEGNADVALVALSLAVVTDGGKTLAIDESLHQPLIQALAVCGKGPDADAGRQFVAFLGSPRGVEIMKRYGFALPE